MAEPENHDDSEVTRRLARAGEVQMPERVTGRMQRALRAEAAQRETSQRLEAAKRDYAELVEHASLGTYGSNVPTSYDPAGVGIDLHEATASDGRG